MITTKLQITSTGHNKIKGFLNIASISGMNLKQKSTSIRSLLQSYYLDVNCYKSCYSQDTRPKHILELNQIPQLCIHVLDRGRKMNIIHSV